LLLAMGNLDGAIADLNRALALQNALARNLLRLRLCLPREKDFIGANRLFRSSDSVKARDGGSFSGRGTARMSQTDFPGAILDLNRGALKSIRTLNMHT